MTIQEMWSTFVGFLNTNIVPVALTIVGVWAAVGIGSKISRANRRSKR